MNPILRRVREAIRDSGESQNALARAGVGTQAMISNWFTNDQAEPGSGALGRLCEVLGLNGHWLLTGQGDQRVIPAAGAEALMERGVQKGLQRAEEAIRHIRTLADERDRADRAVERGAKAKARQKAADTVRRAGQGSP